MSTLPTIAQAHGRPAPQAGADQPALALAQLKTGLWADALLRVYALVLADRVPELPARLQAAQQAGELLDHECLWPGAQPPERLARAPYLLALRPDSPLTDWLLAEAAQGLPDWGLVLRSPLDFMGLRTQARALCEARLPDGSAITLDWMDPRLLRELLPLAEPDQLDQFFLPMPSLAWAEGKTWHHHSLQQGRLHTQSHGLI